MNKETFVKIIKELDDFFNETLSDMEKVGFNVDDNPILQAMDAIADAVDEEMDPERLARKDKYCYDCGSFIFEYLFYSEEFNEVCKTPEELYDYIINLYKEKA